MCHSVADKFTAYMRAAIYVDVEFQHSFKADVDVGAKSFSSIASAVRAELAESMAPLRTIFGTFGVVLGLTSLFVFVQ